MDTQDMQVASVIFLAVTGIATFFIAIFTYSAALATKRGVQAQVIADLLKEYAQKDMADDVSALRTWRKQNDEDISRDLNIAKDMDDIYYRFGRIDHLQAGVDLNSARRNVSHYFQKVHRLRKGRLISKKVVKLILDKEQVETWRHAVEPLEWLHKFPKPYARKQFDELGKIFKVEFRVIDGLAEYADQGK